VFVLLIAALAFLPAVPTLPWLLGTIGPRAPAGCRLLLRAGGRFSSCDLLRGGCSLGRPCRFRL